MSDINYEFNGRISDKLPLGEIVVDRTQEIEDNGKRTYGVKMINNTPAILENIFVSHNFPDKIIEIVQAPTSLLPFKESKLVININGNELLDYPKSLPHPALSVNYTKRLEII